MDKKLWIECGCKFHQIEIEEFTIDKVEGSFISFCIYEHRSGKTGKLFKKRKLLADVVLHPKETEFFKSAFKNE